MLKIALVQNVPINDHRVVHIDGVARELVNRGYDVGVVVQGKGDMCTPKCDAVVFGLKFFDPVIRIRMGFTLTYCVWGFKA